MSSTEAKDYINMTRVQRASQIYNIEMSIHFAMYNYIEAMFPL